MAVRLLSDADAGALLGASGDPLAPFVAAMIREGTAPFAANVRARVRVVDVGGGAWLAATVPVGEAGEDSAGTGRSRPAPPADEAYVASPLTHFARYPRDELGKLPPALRRPLGALLTGLGGLLRLGGIERTVMLHSALVSTNLWPRLDPEAVPVAARLLADAYPGCAVAVRSLDAVSGDPVLGAVVRADARMVPSRLVYHQRPAGAPLARNERRDARLLARSPWHEVPVSPSDAPRVADLYRLLYLDRYSRFNPAFTARFFADAIAGRWLRVHAFAHEATPGRLDAVLGCYVRDGRLTCPLFGYDTALPREAGLYRLLSARKLQIARDAGLAVHASAGAGGFKASRGGIATPEFLAVFDAHLPPARRLPWAAIATAGRAIALPLLRRYAL